MGQLLDLVITGIEKDRQLKLQRQQETQENLENRGDFNRGLRSGTQQTIGLLGGAMGLTADAVGADELAQKGYDFYQDRMEASQLNPGTERVEEIEGFGDAVDWLQYNIGKQVPNLLAMALGGGLTGAAGKTVLKKAAEAAVKKKIASGLAEKVARQQVATRIAQAGTVLSEGALEAGGYWGTDVEKHGVDESHPLQDAGFGILSGATNLVTPTGRLAAVLGGGRFGVDDAGKNLLKRVGIAVPKGIAAEGTQEAAQELIGKVNEKLQDPEVSLTDKEALSAYINSFAAGGAIGGIAGPIHEGLKTNTPEAQTETPQQEPEGILNKAAQESPYDADILDAQNVDEALSAFNRATQKTLEGHVGYDEAQYNRELRNQNSVPGRITPLTEENSALAQGENTELGEFIESELADLEKSRQLRQEKQEAYNELFGGTLFENQQDDNNVQRSETEPPYNAREAIATSRQYSTVGPNVEKVQKTIEVIRNADKASLETMAKNMDIRLKESPEYLPFANSFRKEIFNRRKQLKAGEKKPAKKQEQRKQPSFDKQYGKGERVEIGSIPSLLDEQGRRLFPQHKIIKNFKKETGLGQAGVRFIQAAQMEGESVTLAEAVRAEQDFQDRKSKVDEQLTEDKNEEQSQERTIADYTIATEDKGDFSVQVMRHKDGSVTIFDQSGDVAPVNYNAAFARDKTDQEILSYNFEPLGVNNISSDESTAPKAMGKRVDKEADRWAVDSNSLPGDPEVIKALLRRNAASNKMHSKGKPLAPLAQEMAEITIKTRKMLTDSQIEQLAQKYGVTPEIVKQLDQSMFTYGVVQAKMLQGDKDAKAFLADVPQTTAPAATTQQVESNPNDTLIRQNTPSEYATPQPGELAEDYLKRISQPQAVGEEGFKTWFDTEEQANSALASMQQNGVAADHVGKAYHKDTDSFKFKIYRSQEEIDRINKESRAKWERDAKAEEAKAAEEKAKREDIKGFDSGLTPVQRGRVLKSLNKQVRHNGKVVTRKEFVESLVSDGEQLSTRQENKVKPMSRKASFRATQQEQDAHEKRIKEAGKKTVYSIGGYDVTKTEYDYAKFLQDSQPQISGEQGSKEGSANTSPQETRSSGAEVGVKEPWQMTKGEFVADQENRTGLKRTDATRVGLQNEKTPLEKQWLVNHKNAIKFAIKKGKPVPQEVLADYPDLQPGELAEDYLKRISQPQISGEQGSKEGSANTSPQETRSSGAGVGTSWDDKGLSQAQIDHLDRLREGLPNNIKMRVFKAPGAEKDGRVFVEANGKTVFINKDGSGGQLNDTAKAKLSDLTEFGNRQQEIRHSADIAKEEAAKQKSRKRGEKVAKDREAEKTGGWTNNLTPSSPVYHYYQGKWGTWKDGVFKKATGRAKYALNSDQIEAEYQRGLLEKVDSYAGETTDQATVKEFSDKTDIQSVSRQLDTWLSQNIKEGYSDKDTGDDKTFGYYDNKVVFPLKDGTFAYVDVQYDNSPYTAKVISIDERSVDTSSPNIPATGYSKGSVGGINQAPKSERKESAQAEEKEKVTFPFERVRNAYAHTSLSPGDAALVEKQGFERIVNSFEETLQAETPEENKGKIAEAVEQFKRDFIDEREKVWARREVTVSSHIAGKSKFNSKQAGQRGDALTRAENAFDKWVDKRERETLDELGISKKRAEKQHKDAIQKAEKKEKGLRDLAEKIINYKRGDKISSSNKIVRVTKGRDGYPVSIIFSGDGIIKGVNDKINILKDLFDNDKEKYHSLIDEARGVTDDPKLSKSTKTREYPLAPRDKWWGDADYKQRGGKIVYVAPDTFLESAKSMKIDEDAQENINDLKDHVSQGRSLDPLVLYGADKTNVINSDGRHRAYMAKELGIKLVPVIDFTGTLQGESKLSTSPTTSTSANIHQELTSALGRKLNRLLRGPLHIVGQEEAQDVLKRWHDKKYSVVWHGTPHRGIEQFSTDNIGTGEGAQAYGWGLYFTDKEEIAEWYREKLSGDGFDREGYTYRNLEQLLNDGDYVFRSKKDLDELDESLAITNPNEDVSTVWVDRGYEGESIYRKQKDGTWKASQGQLYKVEIPDDDVMLHWDKPLSEQPEKVREALSEVDFPPSFTRHFKKWVAVEYPSFAGDELYSLAPSMRNMMIEDYVKRTGKPAPAPYRMDKGQDVYYAVIFKAGGTERAASEYLNSLGIKGIKYLDGTSRNGSGDGYNYVIFDGADTRIIEVKYSKDGQIQGFTTPDGNVYLVQDGIEKGKAMSVLAHEMGVHLNKLGFKQDKAFQRVLSSVKRNQGKSTKLGKLIDEAASRVPSDTNAEHHTEEILAYLVENNPDTGIVRRFVALVKKWLVEKVGISADVFNADDLHALALAAIDQQAGIGTGERVKMSVQEKFKPVDTESAAFKKWFKGSKVVDENGEPLVVYHGTGDNKLDGFKEKSFRYIGAYFTSDPDYSNRFSGTYTKGQKYYPNTLPVYVSIKNPFLVDMDKNGTSGSIEIDNKIIGFYRELSKEALSKLESLGFDGIITKYDGNKTFEIVAFSPTQIKSAISNTGAFSESDPRIQYSVKQADRASKETREAHQDAAEAVKIIHSGKYDSNVLIETIGSMEHIAKNDPTTSRLYKAQDMRQLRAFEIENKILDNIDEEDRFNQQLVQDKKDNGFVKLLSGIQKNAPQAYEQGKNYILDVDRTGEAFTIQHDESYEVQTPDGKHLGYVNTKEEGYRLHKAHHQKNGKKGLLKDYYIDDEKKERWAVYDIEGNRQQVFEDRDHARVYRMQLEIEHMKKEGLSGIARQMVTKVREVTARDLDIKIKDLENVLNKYKELDLTPPEVEVPDESKRYVLITGNGHKLTDDKGKTIYYESGKQAEEHLRSLMKSHKKYANVKVKKQTDNEIMAPVTLNYLMAKMGELEGSYFPRVRNQGKYIIRAISKDGVPYLQKFDMYASGARPGVVVQNAEDLPRWKRLFNKATPMGADIRRLQREGYKDINISLDESMPESVYDATKIMSTLQQFIDAATMPTKEESDLGMKSAMEELHKKLLGEISDMFKSRGYLSSRIKRAETYVTGFEEDPLLAITKSVKGLSAGVAKKEAAQQMMLILAGRDVSFKQWQEEYEPEGTFEEYLDFVNDRRLDPQKQKRLAQYVDKWVREVLRNEEYADRVTNTLRSMAIIKFLGFRVSSAAVNATNMVQAVPAQISAATKVGLKGALKQVTRSANAYGKFLRGNASEEDAKIFTEIVVRGWDEAQFNQETARMGMTEFGKRWDTFMTWGMKLFGIVEKANRAMTIHAAYKALDTSIQHDERMEQARQISNDAHGEYNKGTRPSFTQGSGLLSQGAKLAWTFMKFTQNYAMQMHRLGIKEGKTKEAMYMALSPTILGGLGASAVTPLISGALSMVPGFGDDPEEDLYQWVEDTFGSDRLIRHGLPALVGVNFKGSLQMNNPLPSSLSELFGAPGAVVTDLFDAQNHARKGEWWKAFEKAMPTGFGNISKGIREYGEGVTTGSYSPVFYGDQPLKGTFLDAALRVASFNPSRLSGIREKQYSEYKIAKKYNRKKYALYSDLKKRIVKNNGKLSREDWIEIIEKVHRLNEVIVALGRNDIKPIKKSALKAVIKRTMRAKKAERMRKVV